MTITNNLTKTENLSDEFYCYANELEQEWRHSLPKCSDKELLAIFPEAKSVIPKKIVEWENERQKIVGAIRDKLTNIKKQTNEKFSCWFWREWIKRNEGIKLLEVDRHLARLRTLQAISKGKKIKGRLTEAKIQQALTVPIEQILNQSTTLRRSGKNLVGLCPLHKEKHPSFFVYPKTNSCWCFGCNQGGNTINLIRLLHGYSFKEAVKYLTGG